MLLPVPIILMLVTALVLFIIRLFRPKFQYAWFIAISGAFLALVVVFLWQLHLPQMFSFLAWQSSSIFAQSPHWSVDSLSWPFAISLATLLVAVILTSIASKDMDTRTWIGTLVLCAAGLASVTAGNLLTLVLVWAFLDLVELIILLQTASGEKQNQAVVVAFAARIFGIGVVLWASTTFGPWADFRFIPAQSEIYLMLAAGLRLGVIPVHLPYKQDNVLRRGFGTTLRLVSAASSLILLARLPEKAIVSPLTPYLFLLAALTAIYAGWKWLRESDETTGRPFWILGLASLALASALRANPVGSAAWSIAMVLGGEMLFLYSARQRSLLWLLLLGVLGLSTLPFSLTASGWQSGTYIFPLFWIIFIPAQVLLIAGFVRHALHPGESSLESQPRLIQLAYMLGLLIPLLIIFLLGIWGWKGAARIGVWWISIISIILTAGSIPLVLIFLPRFPLSTVKTGWWSGFFQMNWIFRVAQSVYGLFERISRWLTDTLEGDGGILWSFLLLVLLLSVFSNLR